MVEKRCVYRLGWVALVGEAVWVPYGNVVYAGGLFGLGVRIERGGGRTLPSGVGRVSDVVILGVGASPAGLEVPS